MAATAKGTPYVEPGDNVADYPTISKALADHIDAAIAAAIAGAQPAVGTSLTLKGAGPQVWALTPDPATGDLVVTRDGIHMVRFLQSGHVNALGAFNSSAGA